MGSKDQTSIEDQKPRTSCQCLPSMASMDFWPRWDCFQDLLQTSFVLIKLICTALGFKTQLEHNEHRHYVGLSMSSFISFDFSEHISMLLKRPCALRGLHLEMSHLPSARIGPVSGRFPWLSAAARDLIDWFWVENRSLLVYWVYSSLSFLCEFWAIWQVSHTRWFRWRMGERLAVTEAEATCRLLVLPNSNPP